MTITAVGLALAGGAAGAAYALGERPAAERPAVTQSPTPAVTVSPFSHATACLLLMPLLQRTVDLADDFLEGVAADQGVYDKLLADYRGIDGAWPLEMRPDIDRVVLVVRSMRAGKLDTKPLGEAGLALSQRCRPYAR